MPLWLLIRGKQTIYLVLSVTFRQTTTYRSRERQVSAAVHFALNNIASCFTVLSQQLSSSDEIIH